MVGVQCHELSYREQWFVGNGSVYRCHRRYGNDSDLPPEFGYHFILRVDSRSGELLVGWWLGISLRVDGAGF